MQGNKEKFEQRRTSRRVDGGRKTLLAACHPFSWIHWLGEFNWFVVRELLIDLYLCCVSQKSR